MKIAGGPNGGIAMKCAHWGLLIVLLTPARAAMARQQTTQPQDPVAEAARRARGQKQQQAKATKVWNNDNIPKSPDGLSVIGQASPESQPTSADSSANAPKTAASGDEKKATPAAAAQKSAIESDLAAAKEQLQTLQNDLDILQRKYTLDQQMFYGKPNYAADKAGAASLQDEQDQIDAKQQEMITAQQKIADLQAKLNAASPAPSSETKDNSQ
jgi:hypothetical protein